MDNFLHQHVHFPTREDNMLYILLTSTPNIVNCIDCHGKLGSSDHVLILANLNLSTVVPDNPQEVQD